MSACFVGVDIGLDGGITALIDGAPIPAIFPMPTTEVSVTKKRKGQKVAGTERRLDAPRVRSIFAQLRDQATEIYVMIERPQLRPTRPTGHSCNVCGRPHNDVGQSLTAQVKFYGQFDRICGILEGLGIPYEDVHPSTWKADVFRGASDKTDARVKASQLYPLISNKLTLKKSDGLAESVLLADYGRRRRNAPF